MTFGKFLFLLISRFRGECTASSRQHTEINSRVWLIDTSRVTPHSGKFTPQLSVECKLNPALLPCVLKA